MAAKNGGYTPKQTGDQFGLHYFSENGIVSDHKTTT
jgi:hypothetical protein